MSALEVQSDVGTAVNHKLRNRQQAIGDSSKLSCDLNDHANNEKHCNSVLFLDSKDSHWKKRARCSTQSQGKRFIGCWQLDWEAGCFERQLRTTLAGATHTTNMKDYTYIYVYILQQPKQ